jgi:hypothetical protein
MARNREDLCLSARYIHTGNSGVTLYVNRDVKRQDRAVLSITNGAFGAFSTEMKIRGNDYAGMTAPQLRDLSLMFMEAAAKLEAGDLPLMNDVPNIVPERGERFTRNSISPDLEDFLPTMGDHLNVPGSRLVPELLKKHPEFREFYAVYIATEASRKKKEGAAQEAASSVRELSFGGASPTPEQMEAFKKAMAEARREVLKRRRLEEKQERVLSSGLAFLRAYWHSKLSEEVLNWMKAEYIKALDAYNVSEESEEIDDDSDGWPRTVTISQL